MDVRVRLRERHFPIRVLPALRRPFRPRAHRRRHPNCIRLALRPVPVREHAGVQHRNRDRRVAAHRAAAHINVHLRHGVQ